MGFLGGPWIKCTVVHLIPGGPRGNLGVPGGVPRGPLRVPQGSLDHGALDSWESLRVPGGPWGGPWGSLGGSSDSLGGPWIKCTMVHLIPGGP